MPPKKSGKGRRQRTFLNAGCGRVTESRLPPIFDGWNQVRVDVDPAVEPDLVASIVDLSQVSDASVDAVWCSHCVEHLFAHQVPAALAEFRRVLKADGFACVVVPDLQEISAWIAADKLHETIYDSPAGAVTAHDMVWGYGPAIARGASGMAHHCGFTPTLFMACLEVAGFSEIVLRRKSSTLELAGLAMQQPPGSPRTRERMMTGLGLSK